MHRVDATVWTARLGHLLITERYGFSPVRLPGEVPVAARSRTARLLARRGPKAIAAVCEAWPGITTLPIWPDFHRTLIEQPDLGPPPAPMQSPLPSGAPPSRLGKLLERLAYLHDEEEFQGLGFGLLTLCEAWRGCLYEVDPDDVLETHLDSPSPAVRRIVRFFLQNHRVIDDDRPLPLGRIPSGHFVQHPLHAPVLLTMSRLLPHDGSGSMPRRCMPDRDGDWSPAERGEAAGC
jgi:hypothetical protein